MQGKCAYIETVYSEPCPNNRTKLFFDKDWSGLLMWVCDEHFDLLREEKQQERARFGYEEPEPIIFDAELAAAVEGRKYY